jgi:hypothetical protein
MSALLGARAAAGLAAWDRWAEARKIGEVQVCLLFFYFHFYFSVFKFSLVLNFIYEFGKSNATTRDTNMMHILFYLFF